MADNNAVACRLSNPELLHREATLLTEVKSALITTQELPDGYAFRVPGDKKCLAMVAELMIAERECCPFLSFGLSAEPNQGPLVLRVTGPAGTKDFLRSIALVSAR